MNEKRANGMILMTAILLAVVMAFVFIMCSCSTKKVVTEYVEVHDTLRIAHSDTVTVERLNLRHDTVRIESERIVTLLQPDKSLPAETIRVETNNWHYQHEVVKDSASKVVARVDSILRALDRQRYKQTVKTKPPIDLRHYGIFLLIVAAILIFAWKTKG